ncbi:MAG TPA: peptidoglycan DD-metalloendopeptidase family protein [Vicinamibacterales bacterium]|nr:peptidoglycan DD-metalloendopeptidase family protein [Vicinamibacterales bacterium]
MRALLKFLLMIVLLAAVGLGGAWWWAGRMSGPSIDLKRPDRFVGQSTSLELTLQAPEGRFSHASVTLAQNGVNHDVFTLAAPAGDAKKEAADRLYIIKSIGRKTIPDLRSGPARITVRAARPVLYGLREIESVETRDVQVRLEPPQLGVLSTFHFINHGGSEVVVYRVTPEDVMSGVRVGDKEYPGYPAKGAGIGGDPALRVAFFALLHDQPLDAPIQVFARDEAGNEAVAALDNRVFPKAYQKSRIEIDDRFLNRVVPAIAGNTPSIDVPSSDPLAGFLKINGDLRRANNAYIAGLAAKSSPELMFMDAFQQLGDSQVEAKFADTRTYVYQGKDVDQQVHLGFDLAVTANVPIKAAQKGVIVHAAYLGIYGNCVIIDHGMGIQSLYGHLSSIDAKVGDRVEKGQVIGRSGMTGLAGGDHLHFTMLVGGQQVTPVDWWSQQWMEDRVLRKIKAAGGPAS